MQINYKDIWAGLFFIAMGAAFAISAQMNLRIGSGLNMGPGYFLRFLGAVLVLLGAIIVIDALREPNSLFGSVSWRGIILVIRVASLLRLRCPHARPRTRDHGLVVFGVACVDRISVLKALAIGAVLTIFASAHLAGALGLPIALIGPWLGGY